MLTCAPCRLHSDKAVRRRDAGRANDGYAGLFNLLAASAAAASLALLPIGSCGEGEVHLISICGSKGVTFLSLGGSDDEHHPDGKSTIGCHAVSAQTDKKRRC